MRGRSIIGRTTWFALLIIGFAGLTGSAAASPLAMGAMHAFPQTHEPFGLTSRPERALMPKWKMVTNAMAQEDLTLARCRENEETCPKAAQTFLRIIDRAAAMPAEERLAVLNREINWSIRPVDDMTQYGVRDFWAPPLMTFSSGMGDCEDYAIAKYAALKRLGVRRENLRIVVVFDSVGEQHAVAAVRQGETWLILDNKTNDIYEGLSTSVTAALYALDDEGIVSRRPPAGELIAALWLTTRDL